VLRTPDQALTEAQQLLDAGRPFHAHEVLEDAWKSAPEDERQLWRGLAQLAVGLTHVARGNDRGGARLLERGAGNIGDYADVPPHDIDVAGLVAWARELAARAPAVPRPRRARAAPAGGLTLDPVEGPRSAAVTGGTVDRRAAWAGLPAAAAVLAARSRGRASRTPAAG
jgi:hypothetical protein